MPDEIVTPEGCQRAIDAMSKYPTYHGAHDVEDELYSRILVAIAEGKCPDPTACARVAIKSKEFPFPRYTS